MDIAVSVDELAVVYPSMIRAGHVSGGNFIVDREWQVHGGHLVLFCRSVQAISPW